MHMPEYGEEKLPSTLEPAPNGTIGTARSLQIFAMAETSTVDFGYTTATGLSVVFAVDQSERPWFSITSSSKVTESSPSVLEISLAAYILVSRES